MVSNKSAIKQQEVEKHWNEARFSDPDPDKTLQELYGDIEDWTLYLGDYQLILYPLSGQWIYYDKIHEGWEYTGYNAGEAFFYLKGDDIFIEDLRKVRTNAKDNISVIPGDETQSACVKCNKNIPSDSKFCPYCGCLL